MGQPTTGHNADRQSNSHCTVPLPLSPTLMPCAAVDGGGPRRCRRVLPSTCVLVAPNSGGVDVATCAVVGGWCCQALLSAQGRRGRHATCTELKVQPARPAVHVQIDRPGGPGAPRMGTRLPQQPQCVPQPHAHMVVASPGEHGQAEHHPKLTAAQAWASISVSVWLDAKDGLRVCSSKCIRQHKQLRP